MSSIGSVSVLVSLSIFSCTQLNVSAIKSRDTIPSEATARAVPKGLFRAKRLVLLIAFTNKPTSVNRKIENTISDNPAMIGKRLSLKDLKKPHASEES